MMEKRSKGRWRRPVFLASLPLAVLGFLLWVFFFSPYFKPLLKPFSREKGPIPPEERKMREEIVLKRMEDPTLYHDWRSLAPEYPRPGRMEGLSSKDRLNAIKGTPEFKEMDKELKEYLRKKEDLFQLEVPVPALKEAEDLVPTKDRGTEKVVERLLGPAEKGQRDKPLEENVRLGMKGPLASRRILERPPPPRAKVNTEAEIELTIWVLPDGLVDRAVPSVRGDAGLEQIAIQYLKQWRFASLPKDLPQVEQWGTLPFKFRLQ
jgi:TonB family protein